MNVYYILRHTFSVIEPRNYKLLCTVSDLQDGWSVEIRQRMSGKGQGGLYRVYFKDGKQYLVKILGKVFCLDLVPCCDEYIENNLHATSPGKLQKLWGLETLTEGLMQLRLSLQRVNVGLKILLSSHPLNRERQRVPKQNKSDVIAVNESNMNQVFFLFHCTFFALLLMSKGIKRLHSGFLGWLIYTALQLFGMNVSIQTLKYFVEVNNSQNIVD